MKAKEVKAVKEVKAKPKPIAVEATRLGFYHLKRRKPGERFVLADEKFFSNTWMKKLGKDADVEEQDETSEEMSLAEALRGESVI